MGLTLRRHGPDDPSLTEVLDLIRREFAYMDGIIDPPSSMHRLTLADLAKTAQSSEIWSLGSPMTACVILTAKADALYIGKLCVAKSARGQGLARRLMDHASVRAQAAGLDWLELQTRVELTNNHAAFRAMGFQEVGRIAHAGFDRPTSITFRRPVRLAKTPG